MTTLGELLKDGYITIAESETFIHLQNRHGQNLLYSRKTGTYIPFTMDQSPEPELQAIRDYDGWGARE